MPDLLESPDLPMVAALSRLNPSCGSPERPDKRSLQCHESLHHEADALHPKTNEYLPPAQCASRAAAEETCSTEGDKAGLGAAAAELRFNLLEDVDSFAAAAAGAFTGESAAHPAPPPAVPEVFVSDLHTQLYWDRFEFMYVSQGIVRDFPLPSDMPKLGGTVTNEIVIIAAEALAHVIAEEYEGKLPSTRGFKDSRRSLTPWRTL